MTQEEIKESIFKMYFWTKRLGDIHIAGVKTTLCKKPMLGNNYATQKEKFATCAECVKVMEESEK